jgi:hypothetical protein
MKTILKYFFVSSIVVPVDICSYHQHIFKIEVIKVGFLRCVESLKISQGIKFIPVLIGVRVAQSLFCL